MLTSILRVLTAYGMSSSNALAVVAALAVLGFIILCVVIVFGIATLASPYHPPMFRETIDITGRRKPSIEDLIDELLISEGIDAILKHHTAVESWLSRNPPPHREVCLLGDVHVNMNVQR